MHHALTSNHHALTSNHHALTSNHHALTSNHHALTSNHHALTSIHTTDLNAYATKFRLHDIDNKINVLIIIELNGEEPKTPSLAGSRRSTRKFCQISDIDF
jgi:hypothetical protein